MRTCLLEFGDARDLDFVAIVKPEGVEVIGDKLGQYLLRWEGGTLAIQPFHKDGTEDEPPVPPEELSLIPAVKLFPNETLASSGYPLHGNVSAEIPGFAEGASSLNIGTWTYGPMGSLRLVEAKGLDHSLWDRAAGEAHARSR